MVRPEKPINWKVVDDLLVAGCNGTEIAPHFDISPETLYERTVKEFGIGFTCYSQQKRQKGDSILRAKQFEKAAKGDNSMLIWLGKQRLGQSESPHEVKIDANTMTQFNQIMSQLSQYQDLRMAERSIKTDAKSH